MRATVKSVCLVAMFLVFAEEAFAQTVMSTEPPPGQLGAGQVVYVACGPGKARKITGGNNIGPGGTVGVGKGRQRGPCLPMKY
jgi:hypothetical protein